MKRLIGFVIGVLVLAGGLALTVWLVNQARPPAGGQRVADGPSGAAGAHAVATGERPRVVATTNIVGDLVRQIAGERVELTVLMGPGIDPHLYVATERDLTRLTGADIIVFNGLHLEGKLSELLGDLGARGQSTVALAAGVAPAHVLRSDDGADAPDPHIWFDVRLWRGAGRHLADELARIDPAGAPLYRANAARYLAHLETLDAWVRAMVARIPSQHRLLVTAHDAFGYFGAAYGVEVAGVQGISTASEAGSADLQQIADLVAERGVPAIFLETSIPPRIVAALQAAVRSRGASVRVGGELYSDALGAADGPAGTYVDMVKHNVTTIVAALGGAADPEGPSATEGAAEERGTTGGRATAGDRITAGGRAGGEAGE